MYVCVYVCVVLLSFQVTVHAVYCYLPATDPPHDGRHGDGGEGQDEHCGATAASGPAQPEEPWQD